VDAYVRRVTQLVQELAATRSPEAAVRRALERVGVEVSGILQRAHETAEQIAVQARADADAAVLGAREEAAALNAEGERRAKELDAETDRIWAERHRIVEDARQLAEQLIALAESATERFPPAEEVAGAGDLPILDPDAEQKTTIFPAAGEAPIGPAGEYELEEPPEWVDEMAQAGEGDPGSVEPEGSGPGAEGEPRRHGETEPPE
jgi:hypothetical protein